MEKSVKCRQCGAEIRITDGFCEQCGKPNILKPARKRLGERYIKQFCKDSSKSMKRSRLVIIIVAVLMFLGGLFYMVTSYEQEEALVVFIPTLLFASIYMGLWFWAKTHPFPAILTALILYLALWAIGIAVNPENVIKGIVLRIITIIILFNGISSAHTYHKLQKAGFIPNAKDKAQNNSAAEVFDKPPALEPNYDKELENG